MKESRYNVWVERDGAHYIYNGVSGALVKVTPENYRGTAKSMPDYPKDGRR